MIYYLYIKTHNKTGLKYLGQTSQNPYEYKGSGVYWKRHLKEYGNNVSTELIAAFDSLEDLKVAGQFWSQYWNIVESDQWANLIEEYGEGGPYWLGKKFSEQTKIKMRQSHLGIKFSEQHRQKISLANIGRIPWCMGLKRPEHSAKLKGRPTWNKGKKMGIKRPDVAERNRQRAKAKIKV